ncbi:MAG: type I polyketide synthase, partial [Bacteroidota bacterium]
MNATNPVEPVVHPLRGVAIIGMAGRFPGAGSIGDLWRMLRSGSEGIRLFSEQDLVTSGVDPSLLKDAGYVRARGMLPHIDMFDASFFGFSPREAEITDPQQRIFLECAWEALEDAGYVPRRYEGRIGVYAGAGWNSYLLFNLASHRDLLGPEFGHQTLLGNEKDNLPTRVSYKLNLRGPSINVQTGCSTSLVATCLAYDSLLNYQCDIALAGGVSIPSRQDGYVYRSGGIFSPDGHCRTFDARAEGTVPSSGAGIVVLKRLEDAIADHDGIYAVIRSAAVNNDGGDKAGYTAPSIEGQTAVILEAQVMAGFPPETITYIEAHGTATALGDPIEVTALTAAFRAATGRRGFCAIGSVKANIGHLDTAAGVAGLIKTALAIRHAEIPPSLHFSTPNPRIDFAASPFYVNTRLVPWSCEGAPRRAGVSSFGLGGTNAHLVLEQTPEVETTADSIRPELLVISARTEQALENATANLAGYFRNNPEVRLSDAAHTLQVGRETFEHRRVVVCHDVNDAVQALEARDRRRVHTGRSFPGGRTAAFMFTGQGAQQVDMARELYH